MRQGRWVPVLLLVIGLGFALLGQYYFTYRREFKWDGVLFWGIAIYALALLSLQRKDNRDGWRLRIRTPELGLHTLAALGGAGVWWTVPAVHSVRSETEQRPEY